MIGFYNLNGCGLIRVLTAILVVSVMRWIRKHIEFIKASKEGGQGGNAADC